jgi:hypothetical protein
LPGERVETVADVLAISWLIGAARDVKTILRVSPLVNVTGMSSVGKLAAGCSSVNDSPATTSNVATINNSGPLTL